MICPNCGCHMDALSGIHHNMEFYKCPNCRWFIKKKLKKKKYDKRNVMRRYRKWLK